MPFKICAQAAAALRIDTQGSQQLRHRRLENEFVSCCVQDLYCPRLLEIVLAL